MRGYTVGNNIRESIIRKYISGKGTRLISQELELNENTVASVIRLYKNTGRTEAIQSRQPRQKKINQLAEAVIENAIGEDVSGPLRLMQNKLENELSITASLSTISRSLDAMNYSLKRVTFIPEMRNTLNNLTVREQYCNAYMMHDENSLIFIDKFGVSCSTRINYGRSIAGTPARKGARAVRSKNYSVCAALMKNGLKYFKISDSAYNAATFVEFLRELIANLNNEGINTGRVIMDNASIPKSEAQRVLLAENGFSIDFLPPYTPQLNPIEEVYSKWKHYIALRNPSTVTDLYQYINDTSQLITTEDCQAFFNHMRTFIAKGIRREEF